MYKKKLTSEVAHSSMIGFSSGSVAVSIVMPPASGDPRNTKRAVPAIQNGILLPKIVLTYCEKKNSSDREKLLKFEAEGLNNLFKQ